MFERQLEYGKHPCLSHEPSAHSAKTHGIPLNASKPPQVSALCQAGAVHVHIKGMRRNLYIRPNLDTNSCDRDLDFVSRSSDDPIPDAAATAADAAAAAASAKAAALTAAAAAASVCVDMRLARSGPEHAM